MKPKEFSKGKETISKVDKIAIKVYDKLLNDRTGVTLKKVMQGMLAAIGSASLESIGIRVQDVPCLRQLSSIEAKVNASIQAYVAGRKISTLHDMICEICKDEGVKEFEELGLGPPLSHPLVIEYFCPPETAEYCKITTMEVVLHLAKFLQKRKNGDRAQVKVEEFLTFVAKALGISTVQHLCLRIQSLGLYIGLIVKARNEELKMLQEKPAINCKGFRKGKQSSKLKGVSLAERVHRFFSSVRKETEASQNQSDSTDNDNAVVESHIKAKAGQKLNFSSCPYPSEAEERLRTRMYRDSNSQDPYIMSETKLAEFVASWKGACHNSSISEVLEMMLQTAPKSKFNGEKMEKQNKKKAIKQAKLFKSYPAVGVLNIAVLSMKAGYWDSMYDHFQEGVGDMWTEKEAQTAQVSGAIEVDYKPRLSGSQLQKSTAVSSDQILSALVAHFDQFLLTCNEQADGKSIWGMLRWVVEYEKHIANLFSDEVFSDLGFEGLVEFLEHHTDVLPSRMMKPLKLHSSTWLDHKAIVPQQRLVNFVTQAVHALGTGTGVSTDQVSLQISKQFGVQCVEEMGKESLESILKKAVEDQLSAPFESLLFAGALVTKSSNIDSMKMDKSSPIVRGLDRDTKVTRQVNVGYLGSKSSSDAWMCLSRAPMLCDLKDWSKWDIVFAPSLGPFLDWFENEESMGCLRVLMTCSGAVLRIEGVATAEDFLMVTARGSGEQIAEKLLSLVAVYGGVANVPMSLLKSYAKKALDIRIGLSCSTSSNNPAETESPLKGLDGRFTTDSISQEITNESLKRKQPGSLQEDVASPKKTRHASYSPVDNLEEKSADFLTADLTAEANSIRNSVDVSGDDVSSKVAANCILDCLFALPSEFRVFGGEILLPAFSCSMSVAAVTIFNACRTVEHRLMLHGIGLDMGILEWVIDYESYVISGDENVEQCNNVREQGCKLFIKCHKMLGKREEVSEGNTLESKLGTNNLVAVNSLDVGEKCKLELETSDIDRMKERSELEAEGVVMNDFETSGEVSSLEIEAKKVIKSIRRDEFGIEQEGQISEDSLLARQHARMGRALHCLSHNLYSEDCHFVLELVQNADDNRYAEGVEATLVFIVQHGHVVVLNNEIGFTAANMRALCDVGNSTKSGSNAGYIGHKGIGFKSVFRVTDSPQIHSNGFHVKFDSSQGDIGFILPTIVPAPSDDCFLKSYFSEIISSTTISKSQASWNTRIDLPLKPPMLQGVGMKDVTAMFNDLHPTLLLFLHKLRRIIVRNDVTHSVCHMERLDIGNNLVKLTYGASTSTWFVVWKKLEASISRAGITSTELALAFPLSELPDGSYDAYMEQQKVFAFLPLRTYGLRFIIQGDFILPSSREAVDHNSAWNQWLLSEIPGLFLEAADSFRMRVAVKALGTAITSYMKFVPMEGEVVGFFSSLPRMILSGLRAVPCLPIQDGEGACALPCVLLKGWDEAARSLIPDYLLLEHLGMRYLDKGVALSDALASSLGVQVYGLGTLLNIMKSVCTRKGCLQSLGFNWIHCWLLEWHRCASSSQQGLHKFVQEDTEMDMLKALQSLPFIALSNGTFTSSMEGPLWFTDSIADEEASPHMKMFSLLYSDLRTVHPEILQCGANCSDTHSKGPRSTLSPTPAENAVNVKSVLVKLGVSQLSAHEVIKVHILPKFLEHDFTEKDEVQVVQYLAFVMLHFCSDCRKCTVDKNSIVKKLQKDSMILTSTGLIRLGKSFIHFPVELGNKINMKEIFNDVKIFWPEIDPIYLQFLPSHWSNHCRSFFEGLGVTDFLQVVPVEKTVYDKSLSIWKDSSWEIECNSKGWIVEDWECSEVSDILEALCQFPEKHDQCAKLLSVLDMLWKDQYCQFSGSTYRSMVGISQEKKVTESTFVLTMRQFSWIKSGQDKKLHQPAELFHRCDAVESLLGSQGPYAMPQVQSMGLVKALGLRTSVSINDVYELFGRWNSSGRSYEASVAQMVRIYSFLWTEIGAQQEAVLKLLDSFPCIFVPEMLHTNSETISRGEFYHLADVSWSDATGSLDILDAHLQASEMAREKAPGCTFSLKPLSKVYPSLRAFFVGILCVQEQPDFDGYLSILQQISAFFSPHEAMEQVLGIFSALSAEIESGRVNTEDQAQWKSKLLSTGARIFPTIQDTWISLNEKNKSICWCDDLDLLKDFSDLEKYIDFIVISNGQQMKNPEAGNGYSSNISLISSLDIPRFSELVEPEVIAYGTHNNEQSKKLLLWSFPYAQRYIKQLHPDLYEMLTKTKIEDCLRKLEVMVVDQLFIRYRLRRGLAWSSQRRSQSCLLQADTLYVSLSNAQNYSALYLELSRLFFSKQANSPLANFLHLITLMAEAGSSESSIETFVCSGQGILPLSDVEVSWARDPNSEIRTPDRGCTNASAYLERYRVLQEAHRKTPNLKFSSNVWPPHSSLTPAETKKRKEDDFWDDSRQMFMEVLEDLEPGLKNTTLVSAKYSGTLKSTTGSDESLPSFLDKGDFSSEPVSTFEEKQIDSTHSGYVSKSSSSIETAVNLSCLELESLKPLGILEVNDDKKVSSGAKFSQRDRMNLSSEMTDQQLELIGHSGEAIVFQHLVSKHGISRVKWLNQDTESGAPFDIIIDEGTAQQEFVEVKTTRSLDKDWFEISVREWEFARQKGPRFTIFRVFLGNSESSSARLLQLLDPARLCRDRVIQLALILPQNESPDLLASLT
ncbi:hypothetical protein O6H91_02G052100 [Diphasiastrum complanatum]|nr:hypothetical protein O6H91_02G052100 [Diphasiastrum complanatum]